MQKKSCNVHSGSNLGKVGIRWEEHIFRFQITVHNILEKTKLIYMMEKFWKHIFKFCLKILNFNLVGLNSSLQRMIFIILWKQQGGGMY